MTKSRIAIEQRTRMRARQARAKGGGIDSTLGDFRFNGKASHRDDRKLADEARQAVEPDWSMLTIEQLIAAEKMTLHKLSGGEASWRPILNRVRSALRDAEKRLRAIR